jgi:hypothetical protein
VLVLGYIPGRDGITDDDIDDSVRDRGAVLEGETAMGHDPPAITGLIRLKHVFVGLAGLADV